MRTTISVTRLLTMASILGLLALTIGGAVAQRIEQRSASDRLFLGEMPYAAAETPDPASLR